MLKKFLDLVKSGFLQLKDRFWRFISYIFFDVIGVSDDFEDIDDIKAKPVAKVKKQADNVIEINSREIVELLNKHRSEIFSIEFKRVRPKCLRCNKAYAKKRVLDSKCLDCGKELETICKLQVRLGVRNPGGSIPKPGSREPSIIGGFMNRLKEHNLLTVYDVSRSHDRKDGKKGGYRSIRLDNIIWLRVHKQDYHII